MASKDTSTTSPDNSHVSNPFADQKNDSTTSDFSKENGETSSSRSSWQTRSDDPRNLENKKHGESRQLLIVTEAARSTIINIRDQEEDADTLGLRIEITGSSGFDYSYDLCLETIADAAEDDYIDHSDGLAVIIPAQSIQKLRGATLDISNLQTGGLVIRNPNRPNLLGEMEQLNLTGDITSKVQQILEQRINPMLASHGGFAQLVEVRDNSSVVITMGGGCQGCSLSQLTLSEGIKQLILEAIPEATNVIDATDHTAGTNPYYS